MRIYICKVHHPLYRSFGWKCFRTQNFLIFFLNSITGASISKRMHLKFLGGEEWTNYIKQCFSRHWTSNSEGEWTPEKQETNYVNLEVTPNDCWEKVSKPWCKEGGLRQNSSGSLSRGDRAGNPRWGFPGKARWVEFTGQYWAGESHTQRKLQRCAEGSFERKVAY